MKKRKKKTEPLNLIEIQGIKTFDKKQPRVIKSLITRKSFDKPSKKKHSKPCAHTLLSCEKNALPFELSLVNHNLNKLNETITREKGFNAVDNVREIKTDVKF